MQINGGDMMIAIDIGNTNTNIALMQGTRVKRSESVPTGFRGCFEKKVAKVLRKFSDVVGSSPIRRGDFLWPRDTCQVIICSVSPKALPIVKRCVKKVLKINAKIIGKDISVPITNKYRKPKQVGQDRLVCAYAAMQLYGKPAIVVDLGTAITLDVVSSRGSYEGGIIVPGIRLSAESLYQKTALLPQIDIHKPCNLIGTDTEGSILSGIFYGYGAMISGLIAQISKKIKGKPKVIVTGGYASIMKKYIQRKVDIIDTDLVFKGLSLLNNT